jgi:GTP pyrophosphokinase
MARPIDQIIESLAAYWPDLDASLVLAAYDFAAEAHRGQTRLTGEPYLYHPLAVASILTNIEADPPSIIAALLHDTVEDNEEVKLDDIRRRFGETVAVIVDGVTKLKRLDFASRTEDQAGNLRKMLVAMARDLRVILIKLADRLHNMRTLYGLPPARRHTTADETLHIFAPLAHRLGVWRIKAELEDLSLRYLEPRAYWDIARGVGASQAEREGFIEDTRARLRRRLLAANVPAEVFGRAKHVCSIWRKMTAEDLSLDQINDLLGLRVIVHTLDQCYQALGVAHELWRPIPGEFADYIALPKANGYQSLHSKVFGDLGRPLEIQIRTWEMHRKAEYGVAAHWRYKEGGADPVFDEQIAWLRRLLELSTDMEEQHDYLELLQGELLRDQVFVFTPRGQILDLPAGATPIDFAYRVHTEVGHHCAGARVNGKLVALDHRLQTGDVVDITTSPQAQPKLDWLNIIQSPNAKAKVRRYLRAKTRADSEDLGRQGLLRAIDHLRADERERVRMDRLLEVAQHLGYADEESLLAAVGYGDVEALTVARHLSAQEERRPTSLAEEVQLRLPAIETSGADDIVPVASSIGGQLLARAAHCCNPVPGDRLMGYITRGGGIAVHRADCANIRYRAEREPGRTMPLEWGMVTSDRTFSSWVEVVAIDRVGLLSHLSAIVADADINITAAQAHPFKHGLAKLWLQVEVRQRRQLEHLLDRMRLVADVVTAREIPAHLAPGAALPKA